MAEKHSCTYVYGCFLLYPNSIFIIFYGTVLAPLTTLSLLFRRKKAPKENLGSLKFTVILLYYSMIVATRPEPTVLPPSRYQNGVLQKLNGYFSFILCGKIRVLRCVRVVLGDFVIMVLSLDILISFYHSHLFFVLHMQHIDWIGFKFFFIC